MTNKEENKAEQPETGAHISPDGQLNIDMGMSPEMKKALQAKAAKQARNRGKINEAGFTITQVAEVMSHTILEALDTFNERSATMFDQNTTAKPEFTIRIVPVMFSPEHFRDTGIESRAVFTLEMQQFGKNTVVYRDGLDFTCKRDRANVNGWLPRIWQQFFQYIVNTSMMYNLALNPDNPEVVNAVKDTE